MTFKKFKEKVEEIVSKSENSHQYVKMGLNESSWYRGWEPVSKYSWDKYNKYKEILRAEWYTGGYTGGNCWNDAEPSYETSGNAPEELVLLDEILEAIKPGITFLEYKNLTNAVITRDTRSVGEYYGNSSDYASVNIELESLYNYLKEKGWLDK